ncbi:MAG: radical SAM protein [Candidatus Omnitrophota bacterium]
MSSNLKYAIEFIKALCKAKMFRRRTPFFVSWALTYRCNNRCPYCDMPSRAAKELDFIQISRIIEVLAKRGARFLSLTGGEPLLREDIGRIVDFARSRNLCVKLNTNGSLFAQKANELKNLSALMLSFDGPKHVHDSLRGAGSYKQVMEAVDAARKQSQPVSFYTVLSEANLDFIRDILSTAASLRIKVLFQPATENRYGGTRPNPVSATVEKYKAALDFLYKEKKKGNPSILNSLGGLKLLARWPSPVEISCVNGLLGCRIEPDGEARLCSLTDRVQAEPGNFGNDFEKSFDSLLLGMKCHDCWCAAQVELNRMAAFKWDAITNALNSLR